MPVRVLLERMINGWFITASAFLSAMASLTYPSYHMSKSVLMYALDEGFVNSLDGEVLARIFHSSNHYLNSIDSGYE